MKKKINRFSKKDTEQQFVVRWDGDPKYPQDHYWFDSGQGFTKSFNEATRFTKEKGIRKLGELLHENEIVCELMDVSIPYESPVKVGTALLNNRMGVAELIVGVPQIKGGSLTLVSHTGNRELRIQDFLEELVEEDLQVLWDPERSVVPECNDEYLDAHGFIIEDGKVGE